MKKIWSVASLIIFAGALLFVASLQKMPIRADDKDSEIIVETENPQIFIEATEDKIISESPYVELTEEDVYSFFQTTYAYWQDKPYSGEWCYMEIDGNPFAEFGCGLCCMANIYDTLSPYEVSPLDMYKYAREVSNYSPNGEVAAIGWGDIKATLEACGMDCELQTKAYTYAEFQKQIEECQTAIVLVCSANDDTYWEKTVGHYVNIGLYDKETDTVFLSDPGKIAHNRQWIPLRYVYDALKTGSSYQFLTVDQYIEKENQWKADGITENWIRP